MNPKESNWRHLCERLEIGAVCGKTARGKRVLVDRMNYLIRVSLYRGIVICKRSETLRDGTSDRKCLTID
ncbi:unnamed protein product [Soboliphyme baturini]|uniref:Transposase n=1 Tax=Soboliphyme baturini TaxID=241478 RepID=A0A183JAH3_9BILA|nr:unnamed protein product [Soboliphyme baturini]